MSDAVVANRTGSFTQEEFMRMWENVPYPAVRQSLVHHLKQETIRVDGWGPNSYPEAASLISFLVSQAEARVSDYNLHTGLVAYAVKLSRHFVHRAMTRASHALVLQPTLGILAKPYRWNTLWRKPLGRQIEKFLVEYWDYAYDRRHEEFHIVDFDATPWYHAVLMSGNTKLLNADGVETTKVLDILAELLRKLRTVYEQERQVNPATTGIDSLFDSNPRPPWTLSMVLRKGEMRPGWTPNLPVIWARLWLVLKGQVGDFDSLEI